MRRVLLLPCLLALGLVLGLPASAALKKVPYPEIRIEMPAPFKGDAAFAAMRKAFAAAVAKKDLEALAAVVTPGFRWTAAGEPALDFDAKRDGVHNFKVAFGFRPLGKSADGPTEIGPQWEALAYFAGEESLAQERQSPLVCAPAIAELADEKQFERAANLVEGDNEPAEWVYVVEEVTPTASPTGGNVTGKAAKMLVPVVSVTPAPSSGAAAGQSTPTRVELLLPTGKTGWVPVAKVNPLFVDRLCYMKTDGGWKIAAFDQAE